MRATSHYLFASAFLFSAVQASATLKVAVTTEDSAMGELVEALVGSQEDMVVRTSYLSDIHGWDRDVLILLNEIPAEGSKESENLQRLQALGVGVLHVHTGTGHGNVVDIQLAAAPDQDLGRHLEGFRATPPRPDQSLAPREGDMVLLTATASSGETIPIAWGTDGERARTITLHIGPDPLEYRHAIVGGARAVAGHDIDGREQTNYLHHRDQAILAMMDQYTVDGDQWPLEHVTHLARAAAIDPVYLPRAEFLLERSFHATEEVPEARVALLHEMALLGSPAHTDVGAHNILHELYGENARRLLVAINSSRSQDILFNAYRHLPNERRAPIIRALGKVGANNAVLALGDMLANGDPTLAPVIIEALLEMDSRTSLRILAGIDLPEDLEVVRRDMYIKTAADHAAAGNHESARTIYTMLGRSSDPVAKVASFAGLVSLPETDRVALVLDGLLDKDLSKNALKAMYDFTGEETETFIEKYMELEFEHQMDIMVLFGNTTNATAEALAKHLTNLKREQPEE